MKIDETKLTAYALGEMPADERAAIAAQVASDPAAKSHVEEIRRDANLIEAALKTETLPEVQPTLGRRNWRVVFAVAASVVLVGGLVFMLMPSLSAARRSAVSLQRNDRYLPQISTAKLESTNESKNSATPTLQPPSDAKRTPTPLPEVQQAPPQTSTVPTAVIEPSFMLETPAPAPAAPTQSGVQIVRGGSESMVFYELKKNADLKIRGTSVRPDEGEAAMQRSREGFNTEAYDHIADNAFLDVVKNPLSTFSIDVDTASYSNVRRFLTEGRLPPPDAVRIEELINYFPYDYKYASEDGGPFSASVEVAECPWNSKHRLARVGIKAKEISRSERPASNLVFLLDVSGSMNQPNKLPLVKSAMRMLVEKLNESDRVTIVTYAGNSGLALEPTRGSEKQKILAAIDELRPGGSTNGASGITLAYEKAQATFIDNAVNRVILATDGDFNVGVTDQGQLTRLIEDKAKSGVFLSVLGFGMGNLKDSTMEKLADKGNGNYAYIDTEREAKKVLVEQMTGTLVTVAKDVKIQIEFNPAVASSYRLIGYENRMLAKEDFNDDKKDAGEIGAGHTVTALYEITPVGEKNDAPMVDDLKYQKAPVAEDNPAHGRGSVKELMTLKLRYKQPDGDKSKLTEIPVTDSGATFAKATGDFKFTASVAAFGMLLRESPHKGNASFDAVLEWAEEGLGEDANGYRSEFVELVRKARALKK